MAWQYTPFVFPLAFSLLVLVSVSVYSVGYLGTQGRDVTVEAFATLSIGATLMTALDAAQLLSTEPEFKIAMLSGIVVVSPLLVIGWIVFSLGYTGRTEWLTRRNIAILAVIPALTVVLTLTNYRGLVWSGFETATVGSTVVIDASFGSWIGVYAGYSYILGLVGIYVLLLTAVRSLDLYRGQSVALVVGAFAPLISSIVNMTGMTPISFTTASFGVSGVAFWFAVFRYRFLDVAPMARDTVVGSMPDPYLVVDEKERVVDLNSAAESLFGNVVGRSLDEFIPESGSDGRGGDGDDESDGNNDEDGDRDEVELGGRTFDVTRSSVERGDRTVGEVVLLRDITELKEREEELRRANERLESFASVVSHDLRNPLTIAQGQLKLAMEGEGDLEMVDDAHDRIERIIDDVLAMARKESIEPHAVELEETAREAWGNVNTQDAELMVTIDQDEGGCLEADHDRLLRVFENLFRNSVEHGGDDVKVEVGETPTGFYVEDDGQGFDAPDGVFDPQVGDNTGLGLWIVSEIADAHGWEVRVESNGNDEDGGARVFFETRTGS